MSDPDKPPQDGSQQNASQQNAGEANTAQQNAGQQNVVQTTPQKSPPPTADWNLSRERTVPDNAQPPPPVITHPFNPEENREATRGDLARGLLWLLTFAIGGVLVFIGLGRLEGSVLTQSVFPSLIALAGTALGFYFGSQSKTADAGSGSQSGNSKDKNGLVK